MLLQFLTVFVAAALAGLSVCAVAYLVLRRRIERDVTREVDRRIEQLGRVIHDRVRQGIVDGVAEAQPEEVIRKGQQTLLRNAADWVDQGVNRILGRRRPEDGSDDGE